MALTPAETVLSFITANHRKHGGGDFGDVDLVRQQTELLMEPGSLWNAIFTHDFDAVRRHVGRIGAEILEQRDAAGANPLHMCFLMAPMSSECLRIGKWLVSQHPELLDQGYDREEYAGETCLHIAIVNRDLDLVRYVLEQQPTLLNRAVSGAFFSWERWEREEGGTCYYGETALHFAASTNQRRIVDYLVREQGASLSRPDSRGNTVLHLAVVHNLPGMYDFCENLHAALGGEESDLSKKRNVDGMTPMALAADIGSVDMFRHILNKKAETSWVYGPVQCKLYPLDELDGLDCDMLTAARDEYAAKGRFEDRSRIDGILSEFAKHAHRISAVDAAAASVSERGRELARLFATKLLQRVREKRRQSEDFFMESLTQTSSQVSFPDPSLMHRSVLDVIIARGHLDMLVTPEVQTLVREKWIKFGAAKFQNRAWMALLYVLLFLTAIVARAELSNPALSPWGDPRNRICQWTGKAKSLILADPTAIQSQPIVLSASSCFSSLLCLPTLVGLGAEWAVLVLAFFKARQEYNEFVTTWRTSPKHHSSFLSAVSSYLSPHGAPSLENVCSSGHILSLAASISLQYLAPSNLAIPLSSFFITMSSILCWGYLLWVLQGVRLTGHFVLMIFEMIVGDLTRFLAILVVFLLGFAQAMFTVQQIPGGMQLLARLFGLFRMLGGIGDAEAETQNFTAVRFVLLPAFLLISLLLVNTLIALLSDTYGRISERARQRFQLERARIVRSFEAEMTPGERLALDNRYWTIVRGRMWLQVQLSERFYHRDDIDGNVVNDRAQAESEFARAEAARVIARDAENSNSSSTATTPTTSPPPATSSAAQKAAQKLAQRRRTQTPTRRPPPSTPLNSRTQSPRPLRRSTRKRR